MNRLHHLAVAIILGLSLAASLNALAEPAAVADKPAAKAVPKKPPASETPAYPESTPGAGPARAEDWFVKTWQGRRDAFAKHKADDQHAIVFFGDSITQGWGDDFRGKFPGLKIANRGISGDITRGLLARIDEDVLDLDPRGIVLLIGTNDIDVNVAPKDIVANVKLLLEKIAAKNPKTPVVVCKVFPTSGTKHRPTEQIRELNRLLTEAVRDNKQVTLLDTYTLFANDKGEAKIEEFPDLLHPNDIGYAKWAAALEPIFATLGFAETEADSFKPEAGFEPLFNGRNLDGWVEAKTPAAEKAGADLAGESASADGRFRAVNGRLVVATPPVERRVQQLNTTREFPKDFTLKLDFRATPNADSGVFIRGQQLQCRDYTLAGPYKNLKHYKPQDWNELEITVKGNEAHCTCNGEVLEAALKVPATGPIGVEGDRGQLEYRHIRIHQN